MCAAHVGTNSAACKTGILAGVLDLPALNRTCKGFAHGMHDRISEVFVAFRLPAAKRFLNRWFLASVNHTHYVRIACQIQKDGESQFSHYFTMRRISLAVIEPVYIDHQVTTGTKAGLKIRAHHDQ